MNFYASKIIRDKCTIHAIDKRTQQDGEVMSTQQVVFSGRINGYYLSLQYIGARKRKPVRWSSSASVEVDSLFKEVSEWRKKNGGRFVGGMITPCQFEDTVYPDGQAVRWKFVACFQPSQPISEEQLNSLNV